MYIEQDDELVKTEILPLSNLLKLYESKYEELYDNKEREKLIEKCFINEKLCIDFVEKIKTQKDVLERTLKYTKYCMSDSTLLYYKKEFEDNIELSKSLEMFSLYSKNFLKYHFNELKKNLNNFRIIKNGKNHLEKIFLYINYLRTNFCLEKDCLFPPYLSNIYYQYRFLFSDFLITINSFCIWTKNLFNISISNELFESPKSKTKSKKKDEIERENFSISNFAQKVKNLFKLMKYLNLFKNIINNDDENDEIYLKKLNIIKFNLLQYEESREIKNTKELKNFISSMESKEIGKEIIDYFHLFNINGDKLTKEMFEQLQFDDYVLISLDGEKMKVQIKHFNNKIVNQDEFDLIYIFKYEPIEYLNFKRLLFRNYIKSNNEFEKVSKETLFTILSSNISKNNFESYDTRYKDYKYKYIFQGKYAQKIFDDIWERIIFIPFVIKDKFGSSLREDYYIYINSLPFQLTDIHTFDVINCIKGKLNDIFHEFFHIIVINYSITTGLLNYQTPEIEIIKLKFLEKYVPKTFIGDNEKICFNIIKRQKTNLNDFGYCMEISFYGDVPMEFKLYSSLYSMSKMILNYDPREFTEIYNYLFHFNKRIYFERDGLTDMDIYLDEIRNGHSIDIYNMNYVKSFKEVTITAENTNNFKLIKKNGNRKTIKYIEDILLNCEIFKVVIKYYPLKQNYLENKSLNYKRPERGILNMNYLENNSYYHPRSSDKREHELYKCPKHIYYG